MKHYNPTTGEPGGATDGLTEAEKTMEDVLKEEIPLWIRIYPENEKQNVRDACSRWAKIQGSQMQMQIDGMRKDGQMGLERERLMEKEIADHVKKFGELMRLIEKYRKIEVLPNGCANNVYNTIREHLAKTNNL